MDFKQMILASSDINKDGIAKTSFYLNFIRKNISNGQETSLGEISFNTVCNIYKSLKEFQVDLVFPSNTDDDLNDIVDAINQFRNPINSLNDESKYVDFMNLVIVPDKFEGQYYIVCIDAFAISLTSYNTSEYPNIIRMSFLPEDCLLIEDENFEKESEEDKDDIVEEVFIENPVTEEVYEENAYSIEEEPQEEEIDDEDEDLY